MRYMYTSPVKSSVLRWWRPILSRLTPLVDRISCRSNSNLYCCKHIFHTNILIFTSLNLTKLGKASKTETSPLSVKSVAIRYNWDKKYLIFDRRNIITFCSYFTGVVSFNKQILLSEVDECEETETGNFFSCSTKRYC